MASKVQIQLMAQTVSMSLSALAKWLQKVSSRTEINFADRNPYNIIYCAFLAFTFSCFKMTKPKMFILTRGTIHQMRIILILIELL